MTSMEICKGGEWVPEFICGTNNIFNSYHYPMNNGDNVWEPKFRVVKKGKILENMVYGGGNRGNSWG